MRKDADIDWITPWFALFVGSFYETTKNRWKRYQSKTKGVNFCLMRLEKSSKFGYKTDIRNGSITSSMTCLMPLPTDRCDGRRCIQASWRRLDRSVNEPSSLSF